MMLARLSTDEPLSVPRWDDQTESKLTLPGLGLPKVEPPGVGLNDLLGTQAAERIQGADGMNPQLAAALARANAAMRAAGLGEFSITSGFRSNAQQQALYDAWIASGKTTAPTVARPGHSKHESGTAVDINWSQLNDAQRKFLVPYLESLGVYQVGKNFGEMWHFEYGNR